MESLPDRVCDYIFIVEINKTGAGETPQLDVISRFPFEDHEDSEFPSEASYFCYPYGKDYAPPKDGIYQHDFVYADKKANKIFGSCLNFTFENKGKNTDNTSGLKYRSLCLTSHWPFFKNFNEFLTKLYMRTIEKKIDKREVLMEEYEIPVERVVSNLIFEVPLPPLGKILVQAKPFYDTKLTFSRRPINQLKSLDIDFFILFERLSVNNVIVLLSAVLAEKKILFTTNKLSDLVHVTETIIALIFPFQWHHIYMPVLPENYIKILSSPFPFICGLWCNKTPEESKLDGIIHVNLDTDTIVLYGKKRVEMLPDFHIRFLEKFLRKKLDSNKIIKKSEKLKHKTREHFLLLFVKLLDMDNYSFIKLDEEEIMITLDKNKFIDNVKREYVPFFESLMETQMFQCFIEDMYEIKHEKKKLNADMIFFGEKIRSVTLKSDFLNDTSFLHDKKYECIQPDKLSLRVISINVKHKTFPLFSKENTKEPRDVLGLTCVGERYLHDINIYDIKEAGYIKRKYIIVKQADIFKSFNSKQNRIFDSVHKELLNLVTTNATIQREVIEFRKDMCKTSKNLSLQAAKLKEIMVKRYKNKAKKLIQHLQTTESIIFKHIFESVETHAFLDGVMSTLQGNKKSLEKSKVSLDEVENRNIERVIIREKSNMIGGEKVKLKLRNWAKKGNLDKMMYQNPLGTGNVLGKNSKDYGFTKELLGISISLKFDMFDNFMKKFVEDSEKKNNERLKNHLNMLKILCAEQRKYHESELNQINAFEKNLMEIKPEEDNVIFSKDNNKHLEEVYNKENMIDIYKGTNEGNLEKTEEEKYDKLRNLYSFNLWSDDGIDNVVKVINQNLKSTEEFKSKISSISPVVTNSIAFYKKSISSLESVFGTDNRQNIGLFFLPFTLLKNCTERDKFFGKFKEKLEATVLDLNKIIKKQRNAIRQSFESLKNVEKSLAYKEKDIRTIENLCLQKYANLKTSIKTAYDSLGKIKESTLNKLGFNAEYSLVNFRIHNRNIKELQRLQTQLRNKKGTFDIMKMTLQLTKSACIDILQEIEKERYLLMKKCVMDGILYARKYLTESLLFSKEFDAFVTKNLTEERILKSFFDGMEFISHRSSKKTEDELVSTFAETEDLSELLKKSTRRSKRFEVSLLSQKEVFVNYLSLCSKNEGDISKLNGEIFDFKNNNCPLLSKGCNNLFDLLLESVKKVEKDSENAESYIDKFESHMREYLNGAESERKKGFKLLEELENVKSNILRTRPRKMTIFSRVEKSSDPSLLKSYEEQKIQLEKQIPKRKKELIKKLIKLEKKLAKNVRTVFANYLDLYKDFLEDAKQIIAEKEQLSISRTADEKLYFSKFGSKVRPPKYVIEHLFNKHKVDETPFRRVSHVELSSNTWTSKEVLEELSREKNSEKREKSTDLLSYIEFLSCDQMAEKE